MANIIVPSRRLQQPLGNITPSRRFWTKSSLLYVPQISNNLIHSQYTISNPTLEISSHGLSLTSGHSQWINTDSILKTSGTGTVLLIYKPAYYWGSVAFGLEVWYSYQNHNIQFYGGQIQLSIATNRYNITNFTGDQTNTTITIALSYDGTNIRSSWKNTNGQSGFTTVSCPYWFNNNTWSNTTDSLNINCANTTGTPEGISGNLSLLNYQPGVVHDEKTLVFLRDNPWEVLKPQSRTLYFDAPIAAAETTTEATPTCAPYIQIPSRRLQQPNTELRASKLYANKLSLLVNWNDPSGRNLVGKSAGIDAAATNNISKYKGKLANASSPKLASYSEICRTSNSLGTGDFSFLSFSAPIAGSGIPEALISQCGGGGANGQTYLLANSNEVLSATSGRLAIVSWNGTFYGTSAINMVDGLPHVFIGSRRGNIYSINVDGVQQATASGTAISIVNGSVNEQTFISGIYGYSGWTRATPQFISAAFNTGLSAEECEDIGKFPWGMLFERDSNRSYFDIPTYPASTTFATPLAIAAGELQQATSIPLDKLGSGTPDDTKFLRGDGVWADPVPVADVNSVLELNNLGGL
jgi:hypothetical protein